MAETTASAMASSSPLDGLELPAAEGVARLSAVPIGHRLVFRGAPPDAAQLGLALPARINTSSSEGRRSMLQLGPDEWLLLDADDGATELATRLLAGSGSAGAVVDVSHRAVALGLEGPAVEDVLAAGCPLPLDAASFAVGRATRTLLGKSEVVLWRQATDRFHIEVARSLVPYLVALLGAAMAAEAAIGRRRGV